MNMVIVRNKLNFNDSSAFTKTDQDCHSRLFVYLLSATDKSSEPVKAGNPFLVV
jgi:hypothetical protein